MYIGISKEPTYPVEKLPEPCDADDESTGYEKEENEQSDVHVLKTPFLIDLVGSDEATVARFEL